MSKDSLIIVLTPVKNEEWILDNFLRATSLFADYILIANQSSTDDSLKIAARYSKAIIIDNASNNYDEAYRQNLLLNVAREKFGIGNLLLALDADEIISKDSLNAKGWQVIKDAPLGTVFRFDKPTIFFDKPIALRYSTGFPLGYKDDGVEHKASVIHSTRIPCPVSAKQIFLDDIKFIHLCFVRTNVQYSKNRYYCCVENINKISNIRIRRLKYQRYTKEDYFNVGELKPILPQWFDNDLFKLDDFRSSEYYWLDFEVLKLFEQYGTTRFFNDPIWHFDWNACKKYASDTLKMDLKNKEVITPSKLHIVLADKLFKVISKLTLLFRSFKLKN
jgi:hypothetical protein